MNKKKRFLLIILIPFIGTFLSIIFNNHLIVLASLVIMFFAMILSAIISIRLENRSVNKIKPLPFYKTNELFNLKEGTLIKLKGKLKGINYTSSELTKTKCIGYSYTKFKKYPKRKIKWKITDSYSYSENFFLQDDSGSVKVYASKISISSSKNQKEIKKPGFKEYENLLFSDDTEYVIIGTLYKKDTSIFIKDNSEKNKSIELMSLNNYDIIYNTSKAYNIGCGIFLILFFGIIIGAITSDLWSYLITYFTDF